MYYALVLQRSRRMLTLVYYRVRTKTQRIIDFGAVNDFGQTLGQSLFELQLASEYKNSTPSDDFVYLKIRKASVMAFEAD